MPSKLDKIRLPRSKDRRVKISLEQRDEIKDLHEIGVSQRALAREYNVSRRLISFIVDPQKRQDNLERRAERGGWEQYYDKEKHAAYMRKHRHYKKKVFTNGIDGVE